MLHFPEDVSVSSFPFLAPFTTLNLCRATLTARGVLSTLSHGESSLQGGTLY